MEKIDISNIEAEIKIRKEELINKVNNKKCCEDNFLNVWCLCSYIILQKIEQYVNKYENKNLTLKEAIILGSLHRLYELLFSIHNYVGIKTIRTSSLTVLHVMLRCLYETCYTLEYLVKNDESDLYEAFKCESLRTLLLTYEQVKKYDSSIAKGIKSSIERTFKESDEEPSAESNFSHRSKLLKGFDGRYDEIGKKFEYELSYRVHSQYVHGNWTMILENYIQHDKESSSYRLKEIKHCNNYGVFTLTNRALKQVIVTYLLIITSFSSESKHTKEIAILKNIHCELQNLDTCYNKFREI